MSVRIFQKVLCFLFGWEFNNDDPLGLPTPLHDFGLDSLYDIPSGMLGNKVRNLFNVLTELIVITYREIQDEICIHIFSLCKVVFDAIAILLNINSYSFAPPLADGSRLPNILVDKIGRLLDKITLH